MRGGWVGALVVGLLLMLCAGLWLGGHPAHLPPFMRGAFIGGNAGLNVEATELIEDNYYRSVSQDELTNASLQGMARGLRRRYGDRFSDYFSPGQLDQFQEAISGRFSGIGVSVVEVKQGLKVERVFPGSPAAKAGLEVGDTIVSVDGDSIERQPSDISTAKIKGPEGTEVTLGVRSADNGKVRQLQIVRAEIALPVVSSKVTEVNGHKIGYVRLVSFSEGVHVLLRNAVHKVERQGAEAIVLDLRGNGGGLLDEAVLSASIFLPEGEVVTTTDSRTQGHAVYKTAGDNLSAPPMAILIDGNTASAAEILTAALADDADVPVFGARSYGKGVFQQEVDLSNGGALKLTIGEYFTPDGTNLAGHGIDPDVPVRDRPATAQDEVLERAQEELAAQQGKK
jgi:carboxyl-terminal processing protease